MFIEYAILEDRTESILRHADKWEAYMKNRKGHGVSFESKVRYIKKLAENKKDPLNKYFSDDLLDQVLAWKAERNRLIHALLKKDFAHNEIKNLALQGNELARIVKNRSANYNRTKGKECFK